MYKELKDAYIKNFDDMMEFEQRKQIQQIYLKECQKNILNARDISCLLENSAVESFTYRNDGVYITLNEDFGHMRLYIHETDLDGAPMWLSCFGNYEPEETKMVKEIIKKLPENAAVFDVGANIGWYSIMIKKCFEGVNVYSFEPAPENYARLQKNFRLNDLSVDGLMNIGFYKEKGKLDFYFQPERTGASSIKNNLEQEIETIQVDMDAMDSWITEHNTGALDFIKCDVEGAELFVFQGGIESIKKYKPVIMSEMLRKWSANFQYHPNDMIRLLEGVEYQCYVLAGNHKLKRFGYVDEETKETNYFFLHPVAHSKIIHALCEESH